MGGGFGDKTEANVVRRRSLKLVGSAWAGDGTAERGGGLEGARGYRSVTVNTKVLVSSFNITVLERKPTA